MLFRSFRGVFPDWRMVQVESVHVVGRHSQNIWSLIRVTDEPPIGRFRLHLRTTNFQPLDIHPFQNYASALCMSSQSPQWLSAQSAFNKTISIPLENCSL